MLNAKYAPGTQPYLKLGTMFLFFSISKQLFLSTISGETFKQKIHYLKNVLKSGEYTNTKKRPKTNLKIKK